MKNILLLKTIALYFVSLASFFVSTSALALQEAAPYTKAIRYDVGGRVTGTIAPDPDGSGPLGFLAARNTYNATTGVLEKTETGWLSSWFNESYAPESWSGFNTVSTKLFTYDEFGRVVSTTLVGSDNRVASLTEVNYDDKNRVLCKAQRLNSVSPQGNACVGTQGATPDRISKYTYNDFDLVLTEERAVGTTLAQTYLRNYYTGRLLAAQEDANGNFTRLAYDPAFRVSNIFYPSKTTKGVENRQDYNEWQDYNEYGYDLNNNKTYERKRNGAVINYTIDNNNRVIFKDLADNTKARDVAYNYDLRGLMLSARFGSDAGIGITNIFDGFGNVTSTTNNMGVSRSLSYGYDRNNNRTRITHPDNVYFSYTFDSLNRMSTLNENASDLLLNVNYHQGHGRRSTLSRTGGTQTSYNFDDVLRLKDFTQDLSGTAQDLTTTFQYNPVGQITELTYSNNIYHYQGNVNRAGTYVPNGLNQYTSIAGQAFSYDTNGNLTQEGGSGRSYVYDDENRLVRASIPSATMDFIYDPLGRLFQTTLSYPGGSTTRQFLYDGDALVAEYDGITGQTMHRYVHGDQVDEPLVQYDTSSIGLGYRAYLHANHQGSVIAKTNGWGSLIATSAYDAYGIPAATNADRFGYTGQIAFKELGLNYYKARFYSPTLGRFLQTDPIGYKDNMNMYAYVGNDPMNKIDPTGMYGKGTGWEGKDKEWEKFNKAQQQAAGRMEKHANKLSAKADKLDAKGKPGGDALRAKAGSFSAGASALRSNGSDGKVANAVNSATYQSMGGSATGAAFVQGNGPVMVVNADNADAWKTGGGMAGHVVAHESLHTAGLNDQRGSNTERAYKYGNDAQQDAYKELKGTPQGDINPDHLADEVY